PDVRISVTPIIGQAVGNAVGAFRKHEPIEIRTVRDYLPCFVPPLIGSHVEKIGHRASKYTCAARFALGLAIPAPRIAPVLRTHRPIKWREATTPHDRVDIAKLALLAHFVAAPPEILRMIS